MLLVYSVNYRTYLYYTGEKFSEARLDGIERHGINHNLIFTKANIDTAQPKTQPRNKSSFNIAA
jgi:hypothetical protein